MKVLLTLLVLFFSTLAQSKPLNNLIVFGDSLSDNGNLYKLYQIPTSPPYYKGRFSNGPVWAERLAKTYFNDKANDHFQNYAFGGAAITDDDNDGLISLNFEITNYLEIHQNKAEEDSLYVVWIGANNYLMPTKSMDDTLMMVNKGIKRGVEKLMKAGAKHIMLVNLPDLGVAPEPFPKGSYTDEEIPAIREKLTSFCQRHNELLTATVSELKQSNPEIQWLYYDASSKFKEFMLSPEQYGITNTTDACYSSSASLRSKNFVLNLASQVNSKANSDNCDGYLFFDGVHPTTLAHIIIAEKAKAYLDAESVGFGA